MAKVTATTYALIGVPLILAGGLVSYRLATRPARADGGMPVASPRVISPPSPGGAGPQVVVAPVSPGAAMGPVKSSPGNEPGVFQGWSRWSEQRRNEALAPLIGARSLDLDVQAFLGERLLDRSLSPTTRNNVANVLVVHAPSADLAARLQNMVGDAQEGATWQDYALQHLARVVPSAADPAATARYIRTLVDHGAGSLSGTALLQMQRLESAGQWADHADIDRAAVAMAADQVAALPNRMTAIGMIGSRHLRDQVGFLRSVIAGPSEPALTRTAIAALGQIGDQSDVALLTPYLKNSDGSIVLAAQAAVDRLAQARL